jgi:ribonuclease HI
MAPDISISQVEIYTDGGCDPNPGPGGWGAVLIAGPHTKEISGADPATTNNRMELTAAISALSILNAPCIITIYTDSQYLRRGITSWVHSWQKNGWRKANGRPVENQDLWKVLLDKLEGHRIEWRWVKGHRGNPMNERADRLATQARRKLRMPAAGPRTAPKSQRTPAQNGTLPKIEIYARGCALGDPGPGGYGAILVRPNGQSKVVSGAWPLATNNAMELWAVSAALQSLDHRSKVTVYTTSKYVLDGATRWLATWERRGWRRKNGGAVKNKEIWLELSHLMGDHDIEWKFLVPRTSGPPARKRNTHSRQAADAARNAAEKQSQAQHSPNRQMSGSV